MEGRRSSQLRLKWTEGTRTLPERVEEEVRVLLAQLLRRVVEAECGGEEDGDE